MRVIWLSPIEYFLLQLQPQGEMLASRLHDSVVCRILLQRKDLLDGLISMSQTHLNTAKASKSDKNLISSQPSNR